MDGNALTRCQFVKALPRGRFGDGLTEPDTMGVVPKTHDQPLATRRRHMPSSSVQMLLVQSAI